MIRPEAAAALNRWRETLVGLCLAGIGLYWIVGRSFGILHWLGYVAALIGAVLIYAGVQRARFRRGEGGAGIVSVSEGRIAYFGPLSGGIADLADLKTLKLDPTGRPLQWVLYRDGDLPLSIPVNAEGAEALFDTFAALPGLRTEYMLRQIENPPEHAVVIWQSPDLQNSTRRLH